MSLHSHEGAQFVKGEKLLSNHSCTFQGTAFTGLSQLGPPRKKEARPLPEGKAQSPLSPRHSLTQAWFTQFRGDPGSKDSMVSLHCNHCHITIYPGTERLSKFWGPTKKLLGLGGQRWSQITKWTTEYNTQSWLPTSHSLWNEGNIYKVHDLTGFLQVGPKEILCLLGLVTTR